MDKVQINSPENLKNAILDLETARSEEESMLKKQFNQAYESVKPVNLIASTIHKVVASTEIKQNLLSVSLGMASVYFSKKLLEKGSNRSATKIVGTVILFGITNILARHPELVTNLVEKLISRLRKKQHDAFDVIDIESDEIQYVIESPL